MDIEEARNWRVLGFVRSQTCLGGLVASQDDTKGCQTQELMLPALGKNGFKKHNRCVSFKEPEMSLQTLTPAIGGCLEVRVW